MSARATRVWFALFVLVVFCAGAALGLAVGRRMDGGRLGAGPPYGPGGRGGPPPEILLERLTRQLELAEPQREQLRAVLRASRDRVETLQRETRAGFEAEQRQLHAEIRKVLTPDQQERFERAFRGRRGRGPGRGSGQDR